MIGYENENILSENYDWVRCLEVLKLNFTNLSYLIIVEGVLTMKIFRKGE